MIVDDLTTLLRPTVEGLGYELYDLEMLVGKGNGTLRIFIDKPEGIDLDDCEKVSRQVSAVLDVEDPIKNDYSLEVSSPGLDRRLKTAAHFERFIDAEIKVRMLRARKGGRKMRGFLRAVKDQNILLEVDGEAQDLPIAEIDMARLVPVADFTGANARGKQV